MDFCRRANDRVDGINRRGAKIQMPIANTRRGTAPFANREYPDTPEQRQIPPTTPAIPRKSSNGRRTSIGASAAAIAPGNVLTSILTPPRPSPQIQQRAKSAPDPRTMRLPRPKPARLILAARRLAPAYRLISSPVPRSVPPTGTPLASTRAGVPRAPRPETHPAANGTERRQSVGHGTVISSGIGALW